VFRLRFQSEGPRKSQLEALMTSLKVFGIAVALVAGSFSLVGCDEGTDELATQLETSENKVSELEDKLSELEADFEAVKSDFETLQSAVNDFDGGTNWRDVVPEVQSAVSELDSSLSAMEYKF